MRILCEPELSEDADITYLFGQTPDNEKSVLLKAVEIYGKKQTKLIGFSTEKEGSAGYAGFQHYKDCLAATGVPEKAIIGIDLLTENYNTLSEAEALVRETKKQRWNKIYVTAPAFHLPRVFITTVSVAFREYSQLKVYSQLGFPLSWGQKVKHSQGTTIGMRSELITGEFERIDRYRAKGDLISLEKVFRYLDWRDKKINQ